MIRLKSNAKINLGLNIVEKLPNGYHNLDMIMVPISLSDSLEIDFKGKVGKLKITTNDPSIPTDKRNIIYKIYEEFYKETGLETEEVEVYLEKNIPHEAGLGGGSSNGGQFLKELNKYHGNILEEKSLMMVGKKIGADIPFFIMNKPCRAKGIGEELKEIKNNLDVDVILIKPRFGVSTKEAYSRYVDLKDIKVSNIDEIIKGMEENNKEKIEECIENTLEQGLLISDTNIKKFRKKLNEMKKIKFYMSGSGSCYYTLTNYNETEAVLSLLTNNFEDCKIIKCNFL